MKKKVLIIGTGSIAKRHIENILKLKQKIDLSIFSNNESRAKVFIRKLKSKKIYIAKKKYINKTKFSHVIIASKTIEHNKYINFFFKNCKNIYCEKPLSIDKYTKLLMSLSKKRKINEKIKIGFQFRFNPAIQYLKRELKKKENKNTYLIKFSCGQNLKDWRNKLNYKKLHSAGNNYYGSVNWELSHELDILQFIFDKPNKIFSKFTKTNYLKINATDLSITTLKFKSKKTNCVIALEMLSPILYRKLIVVSLNNYYEIDLVNNIVFKSNKRKKLTLKFKKDRNNMFSDFMKRFINNEKKSKKFDFATLKDGLIVSRIIHKMHESNLKNKFISL